MKTIEAARGRWREILKHFGFSDEVLNGKHHKCPITGEGEDRFRFTDHNGSGDYFCACSKGGCGGFALLKCLTKRDFKDLAKEVDGLLSNVHQAEKRKPTYAEQLRKRATKSNLSAYLASRGLEIAPGLQWCLSVDYWDGDKVIGTYSAMLAPVMREDKFLTYHVTFLQNGKKAIVGSPRKILPGPPISGAGIPLYPPAREMGVAEGIETAIAAKMLFGYPTHSTLNATLMAKWDPPPAVEVLHIFADRDRNFAGEAGAYQLAHRMAARKVAVHIHVPDEIGKDWNDVLLSRRRQHERSS